METYGCGVPIAGYANRAHSGILNMEDVGWGVRMNDIDSLAELIKHLNNDREQIKHKSRNALRLAVNNTFEKTFRRRIEHLRGFIR